MFKPFTVQKLRPHLRVSVLFGSKEISSFSLRRGLVRFPPLPQSPRFPSFQSEQCHTISLFHNAIEYLWIFAKVTNQKTKLTVNHVWIFNTRYKVSFSVHLTVALFYGGRILLSPVSVVHVCRYFTNFVVWWMTWSILGFKTVDLVSSATAIVMLDIRQNVIFVLHYIQGHKFDNCVEEYFFKL